MDPATSGGSSGTDPYPIGFEAVLAARERLRPRLARTPLRSYAALDAAVGHGLGVFVKHENHNPTNSFKVRNGLSVMTALSEAERLRGVVAATRGNHGLGLAWAGRLLGAEVAICVPVGNNPEKNEAMRGLGAVLYEEGRDYDEAVLVADRLVRERGMRLVHSTNDPLVIAGAGTLTLEILEDQPALDVLVLGVGGGSQAVGALTVVRRMRPNLRVYGVQAERASAAHDSWHAGRPLTTASADTFADGLATRSAYAMTFPALRAGLAGFVTVSEGEIAEALRLLLRTTHNLAEGAGAAGLAGLLKLAPELQGASVGIVLSGSNIDASTLRRVVTGAI
jgi:threonine dehydratase